MIFIGPQKNPRCKRPFRGCSLPPALIACFFLMAMVSSGLPLAHAEEGTSGDPIFDGQILSLTEKKPPLAPSNDPRFRDNGDGTVSDLEQGLMWKQQDSYQERKEWMNWAMAQKFVLEMNEKRFAGYDDWKLPTRKELESLYEEDKSIPWKYYWTTNQVHMDPIFGYTSCCFWSSETHKEQFAWTFNYIRGKSYLSPREGPGLSLSVIRPVRVVEKKTAAAKASKASDEASR